MLSAAMMLEWLGLDGAAQTIRHAVEKTLADGAATADLGGKLTTEEMADAVIQAV